MGNRQDDFHRTRIYEGLEIGISFAPTSKRVFAYVTDLAIVTVCSYALIIVGLVVVGVIYGGLGALSTMFDQSDAAMSLVNNTALIILLVVFTCGFFALFHGYFIYYERRQGATPGKKIFGLRVISADNRAVTISQCIMRDFLRYVDCMLVLPGLLAIYNTKRRQRLGDLAANTLVVHSRKEEIKTTFLYMSQESYLFLKAQLLPKPIDDSYAREYLRLGFGILVLRNKAVDQGVRDFLNQVVDFYIPRARELGLPEGEAYRFVFEHCNQSLLQVA